MVSEEEEEEEAEEEEEEEELAVKAAAAAAAAVAAWDEYASLPLLDTAREEGEVDGCPWLLLSCALVERWWWYVPARRSDISPKNRTEGEQKMISRWCRNKKTTE